jgi:hypothetical protein
MFALASWRVRGAAPRRKFWLFTPPHTALPCTTPGSSQTQRPVRWWCSTAFCLTSSACCSAPCGTCDACSVGAPHLDFREQRDEPCRFCASTLLQPLFCARLPVKKVSCAARRHPISPAQRKIFFCSAQEAHFACENAGRRRTLEALLEGGQAGRRRIAIQPSIRNSERQHNESGTSHSRTRRSARARTASNARWAPTT